MKQNKYKYLWVLQLKLGKWFDDGRSEDEAVINRMQELRKEQMRVVTTRIIKRRELNSSVSNLTKE